MCSHSWPNSPAVQPEKQQRVKEESVAPAAEAQPAGLLSLPQEAALQPRTLHPLDTLQATTTDVELDLGAACSRLTQQVHAAVQQQPHSPSGLLRFEVNTPMTACCMPGHMHLQSHQPCACV